MSMEAVRFGDPWSPGEQLRCARQILLSESRTLADLAQRLDGEFCRAVDLVFRCQGSVIVSGMGKAGLIGQKIMATLASTGTRSHCLHPAEAVHGDLGRVSRDDLMLILSQSGETEEVLRMLPSLVQLGVPMVAITGRAQSALGRAANVVLELGPVEEADALGLAPSSSTTAMLALGDALALVTSQLRDFKAEDFARFHPAGSLGRKLAKVEHHMRPLEQCRVAGDGKTVREVFVELSVPGRRTGAIMLVGADGKLTGIFTDSDLARLFERRREAELDRPIGRLMTSRPLSIALGSRMTEAVAMLAGRKISELPVVDGDGRPVGLIDVTDVLGLFPSEFSGESATARSLPLAEPSTKAECRLFCEPDDQPPA
jgi:arabinose-5-phosphate isomerase